MSEETIEIKLSGWPGKRLEKALANAKSSGLADDWRLLFDLSAAYGCLDISQFALKSSPQLLKLVTQKKRETKNRKLAIEQSTEEKKVIAKVNSPTPLARIAWLSAWSRARGYSIEQRPDNSLAIISPLGSEELKRLLNDHPEVTLEDWKE